jgi:C4-type Zn-finger protein
VLSPCSNNDDVYLIEVARTSVLEDIMAKSRTAEVEQEPVGIVISRGSRAEPTPKFIEYVWGPAPESEPTADMVAA